MSLTGMFNAISNRFRQASDDAAEKMKDPRADANAAIGDSKARIATFEQKLAKFRAHNKGVERQRREQMEEVKKWKNTAKAAKAASNNSDALTALGEMNTAQAGVDSFEKQIKGNKKVIDGLKANLAKARKEISDAESQKAQFLAEIDGHKMKQEMSSASNAFGKGDSPLSKINALKELRDKEAAKAEVADEMEDEANPSAALADKYAGAGGPNLDDQLANL